MNFDNNLEVASESVAENISELQFVNVTLINKINKCLETDEDPERYIKNLKEILEMQENLSRFAMELSTFTDDFDPFGPAED